MLTTFGWPVQVAVFYLTFQNVHIPSVTLAAFPIQGHSAESSGIWIFSKEFLVQFTMLNQQKTNRWWKSREGRWERIGFAKALCYTLIAKHVHVTHQSLILKCTRDERKELSNRAKEWTLRHLQHFPSRSIKKNRHSCTKGGWWKQLSFK